VSRILILLALAGLVTGCGQDGPYARKDGEWMYGRERVIAAPHEDIQPINDRFARSGERVWYRIWPIPSADPGTFQALDENYARDADRAWYLAAYRDSQDYFTTRRLRLTSLEGVDTATLHVLEQRYAADAKQVYYEGAAVEGADPASFEPLTEGFARDKNRGYQAFRRPVPFSHGPSFEPVSKSYAKDRERVFYVSRTSDGEPQQAVVPGADPTTFKAFTYDYATDARRIYYEQRVLKGDPATFQPLDFGYARTGDTVFHRGEPMRGADPASFAVLEEVTDEATARDKAWLYKDGERVRAAQ
jgi:hypothetical protein